MARTEGEEQIYTAEYVPLRAVIQWIQKNGRFGENPRLVTEWGMRAACCSGIAGLAILYQKRWQTQGSCVGTDAVVGGECSYGTVKPFLT